MKKYVILAAAAALALASCAKFETSTVSENDGNMPIGFTNYAPTSLVKAGDTYISGADLVDGKTFAVYAWQTANAAFLGVNPGTPNFMNPAVVTWNSDKTSGEGNTYTPVRFWPAGDNPANLSFTAYYPAGNGTGITAPTFTTGVGTYAFTAKAAPADMVDFCVADVVNDQVYGSTNASPTYKNTVKFTFKHQLTKVQFKFKKAKLLGATTVIELVDAKLSGIKNSGTLSATYAQAGTPAVNTPGTTTTSWGSTPTGNASYEVTVNKANPESGSEIVLTETATTVDDKDVFLMVPQDMVADTQKITVTWKVKVYDTAEHATANGATGLLSETTNSKALSFYSDLKTSDTDDTAVAAINWVMNNFVTYTITIGPKPIWFTGEVTEWATEQNGYFNVQ